MTLCRRRCVLIGTPDLAASAGDHPSLHSLLFSSLLLSFSFSSSCPSEFESLITIALPHKLRLKSIAIPRPYRALFSSSLSGFRHTNTPLRARRRRTRNTRFLSSLLFNSRFRLPPSPAAQKGPPTDHGPLRARSDEPPCRSITVSQHHRVARSATNTRTYNLMTDENDSDCPDSPRAVTSDCCASLLIIRADVPRLDSSTSKTRQIGATWRVVSSKSAEGKEKTRARRLANTNTSTNKPIPYHSPSSIVLHAMT